MNESSSMISGYGPDLKDRVQSLLGDHQDSIYKSTDRTFAYLMLFQWVCAIVAAYWISPRTWLGSTSQIHLHVWASIILGGIITLFPVFMAFRYSGKSMTRQVIGVSQMLMSALLIHVTGGRIETHFHVFGSLAFLAFYRDWRVFVPATIVVALDHFLRGIYWPQSVFGVLVTSQWRWLEHAAWVLFEDIFLIRSCILSSREMLDIATNRAKLEITNEKIESLVLLRTKELRETLEEMDVKNKTLVESEQLKTQFVANISHELRTPLTLTISPVETILADANNSLSEKHRHMLQTVRNNAARLLQMVNSLLDFSKLEAKKMKVNRSAVDIVKLSSNIFDDFKPVLDKKSIKGKSVFKCPKPVVEIDPYAYERILFNLLSNATKFTQKNGHVTIELNQKDDDLVLEVSDTGCGIPESAIPHLFERFRQVEGTVNRAYEGTGLGLSLVKEFTDLMQGKIEVSSRENKGTKFTVHLTAPVSTKQEAPHNIYRNAAIEQTNAYKYNHENQKFNNGNEKEKKNDPIPFDGRTARVLVAEDNQEMSDYIASILNGVVEVRTVLNGVEALKEMESWLPDLILSDVMMPEKDGLTLCREVKTNQKTASIPFVLLTAMTHREALLKGWEAGADEYLYKPFHTVELLTRLRALLSAANAKILAEKTTVQTAKMTAVGRLAGGIAHEINNPLGVILGFAQSIVRNVKEGEPLNMPLRSIEREAKRCKTLVQELLNFSRVGIKEKDECELNKLILSSLTIVEACAKVNNIVIIKEMSSDLPKISANANQIQQIIINLCTNAIDAMPSSGQLTIRTCMSDAQDKKQVEIQIQDTGYGIPIEIQARIFEPFFTTKEVGKGTGLGLPLVYEIVEKHQGTISFECKDGKGTLFRIRFPICESKPAAVS